MKNVKNSLLADLMVAFVLFANGSAAQALVTPSNLGSVHTMVQVPGLTVPDGAIGEFSNTIFQPHGSSSYYTSITLGSAPQLISEISTVSLIGGQTRAATSASLIYAFQYVTQSSRPSFRTSADIFGRVSIGTVLYGDDGGENAGVDGRGYLSIFGRNLSFDAGDCGSISVTHATIQTTSGCGSSIVPIEDFVFDLIPNQTYLVQMFTEIGAFTQGHASVFARVVVDPVFTILGDAPSDGQFIFSEGVTSPPAVVPEPATLALLGIAGLALSGLRRRYGRQWHGFEAHT